MVQWKQACLACLPGSRNPCDSVFKTGGGGGRSHVRTRSVTILEKVRHMVILGLHYAFKQPAPAESELTSLDRVCHN